MKTKQTLCLKQITNPRYDKAKTPSDKNSYFIFEVDKATNIIIPTLGTQLYPNEVQALINKGITCNIVKSDLNKHISK